MSNSLTLTIDSERISIIAEDGSVLSRTSNLLALDASGQIVSTGKSLEDLHSQRNIRILNPFAIDNFYPKLAAAMISKLVNSAIVLLTQPHEEDTRKPMTMNWHLQIPGYEHLDHPVQESFEYHMQRLPQVIVRSLTINSQPKPIEKFQRAKRAIMIGVLLTVLSLNWLAVKVQQQMMTPEQLTKPLTFLEIVLRFVLFAVIVYFAGLIFILICKLTMKSIIPAPVYKDMIEESELLPKNILRWLQQKWSSGQSGG